MEIGEEVEEDVCRVCRLEADDENPMVHPCRCSGSVRWVHPDCLKSWLASSQKKHCEICGHKYSFTKVYPDHIPSWIPPDVYGRQTVMYLHKALSYAVRCVLVAVVWLVVLPHINMGILATMNEFPHRVIFRILPEAASDAFYNSTGTISTPNASVSTPTTNPPVRRGPTPLPPEHAPFPLNILEHFYYAAKFTVLGIYYSLLNFWRANRTLIALVHAGVRTVFRLVRKGIEMARELGEALGLLAVTEREGSGIVQQAMAGLQDAWVSLGRAWLNWTNGEIAWLPAPANLLRAQILSLLLIGLIIALIFIREWYASFTWPKDPSVEGESIQERIRKRLADVIDPDEWVVIDGVPRRIFERSHTVGGLRLRTDIKGTKFRRALAQVAAQEGWDVYRGGIVKPAHGDNVDGLGAAGLFGQGEGMSKNEETILAIGNDLDLNTYTSSALVASEKAALPNRSKPSTKRVGKIYDPSLLPRSNPFSRTSSSASQTSLGGTGADALRRRSEGDTRGVLMRFPSAPLAHAPHLAAGEGFGEAPLLERSNSSPSNQLLAASTSSGLIGETNSVEGNVVGGTAGSETKHEIEADKGKSTSSRSPPAPAPATSHQHHHHAPPGKLGKLRPPKLVRTFSELEKSPRDLARAKMHGEERDPADKMQGEGAISKAAAGPGPSSLAFAHGTPGHDAAKVDPVSPTIVQRAADAESEPSDATVAPLTPLFKTQSTAYRKYETPDHSSSSPSASTQHPPSETWRAPELLLGMSTGKNKGKGRAAEPEVAKESLSGQLVRAQSISSPTNSVRSSKSPVGPCGEEEGEEGWARRRRISSTASKLATPNGKASTPANPKQSINGNEVVVAEAQGLKDAVVPAGDADVPRRSARLGDKRGEQSAGGRTQSAPGPKSDLENESAAPVPTWDSVSGDLPRRLPLPSEWHDDAPHQTGEADEGTAIGVSEYEAVKAHHHAAQINAAEPGIDEHMSLSAALRMPDEGKDSVSAVLVRPDTKTALAASAPAVSTEQVEAGPELDSADALPFPGFGNVGDEPGERNATSKDGELSNEELWQALEDATDGPGAALPAGGAGVPVAGAPPNAAGARIMRAQLGGFGVELQIEQVPRNQPRRPVPPAPAVVNVPGAAVGPGGEADVAVPPEIQAQAQALAIAAAGAVIDVDGAMEVLEPPLPDRHWGVNPPGGEGDWEDVPFDDLIDGEDDGAWQAEEWEQIWEVLGFDGPLSALFQNLVLAVAVTSAVIMIFIALPLSVGRVALTIDSVHPGGSAPVWAGGIVRFIYAVTVDTFRPVAFVLSWIIRKLVWPALQPVVKLGDLVGFKSIREWIIREVQGVIVYRKIAAATEEAVANAPSAGRWRITSITGSAMTTSAQVYQALTSGSFISSLDQIDHPAVKAALDKFANLGNISYATYQSVRHDCVALARSTSLRDSVLCVLLGYAVAATSVIVYAAIDRAGWRRQPKSERAMRWSMFVKLAIFIIIELVVFPLTIGWYINIAAMPIFPGMTLQSRFKDLQDGSFGTVFVLWMIGTMFMYGFAQVISWIRSICRAGTLYFIRDPHDPNYSAVKDMIERPAHSQLRKMATSTLMYSTVVWMLFGSPTWALRFTTNILPLKLTGFGPLSSVPFDYLFLLVVVPPTIDSIRPRHTLKMVLMRYWRLATKTFRLRALLIGKAYTLQRHSHRISWLEHAVWSVLDVPHQWVFGKYDPAESLMRVPAADSLVLLVENGRRQPMFVPLNDDKTPKTRDAKMRMLRQDQLARKATPKRDPKVDFAIVRLPQYWRTRVHMFIFTTLFASSMFVGLLVVLPIVLGRRITVAWVGDVHDGYSYIAGSYALYIGTYLGLKLKSFVRTLTHAEHFSLVNPLPGARLKRGLVKVYRAVFNCTILFVVHPIARGLVWEMRLGMLIRHGLIEGRNVLHLWDMWAIGAVLNMLEVGACELLDDHRPHAWRDHVMHDLLKTPLTATFVDMRHYALKAVALLLVKSALSYVVTRGMVHVFKIQSEEAQTVIFRLSGLLVWAITEAFEKRKRIYKHLMTVRQDMIDAEYVVEERVENYVEPPKEDEAAKEAKPKGPARRGRRGRRGLGRGHAHNIPAPAPLGADGQPVLPADFDMDMDMDEFLARPPAVQREMVRRVLQRQEQLRRVVDSSDEDSDEEQAEEAETDAESDSDGEGDQHDEGTAAEEDTEHLAGDDEGDSSGYEDVGE